MEPEDIPKIAQFLRVTEAELKVKFLEEIEKFNTKRYRPKLLRKKENDPYGRCIFLSDKAGCTINRARPLQCRTSSCGIENHDLYKWNDFTIFFNEKDPESIRQYSLWLEFNEPLPGGTLAELVGTKKAMDALSFRDIAEFAKKSTKPRL